MTAGLLAGYGSLTLSRPGAAIRSRDTSSNLSPLRGGYNTAPRGAAAIMMECRRGNLPEGHSESHPVTHRSPAECLPRRGFCPARRTAPDRRLALLRHGIATLDQP